MLRHLAPVPSLLALTLGLVALAPPPTSTVEQEAPAIAPAPEVAPEAVPPATVILVRHAEKGSDDPRDPELSEAGEARARDLAQLLAEAGVTHLFASEYRRTADTLAPLAAALEVEVARISARTPAAQVAALRALPAGAVAVVAGHSNTTPGLAAALGVQPGRLIESRSGPAFPEDAYDRILIVTLGDGAKVAPKLLELRYPER